ncbi:MAG TPA: hypothetical protein VHI13_16775 [Candidatus Kapabacteria bacterium]|nr:hypothetical protein [Candidatus Kapabacteria bacterium]
MRRPKSHTLPSSTRALIAQKYLRLRERGASVSYESMARAMNVSVAQVRKAVEDYRAGRLRGARPSKPRRQPSARDLVTAKEADVAAALESISESDERFEEEYRLLVIDIAADRTLSTADRVQLMYKLTQVRLTMQRVSIGDHLHSLDAEVLLRLVRRFVPSATTDDVIKIIREVLAA